MILFTRTTWDLLHTWAGIVLITAAVTHFAIHWKWVTKVTSKMMTVVSGPRPISQSMAVQNSYQAQSQEGR
jgi:hypothetical protein